MDRIGSYGAYQKNYYGKTVQEKKGTEEVQKADAAKAGKNQPVKLSARAEKLLKELKNTYRNMDFFVANYDSDEEAAEYLSRGNKDYSVLLEPETLEEMAADEKTKEKYLNLMKEATTDLKDMKEKLGEEGKEVTHLGVSIDKNGTMSYFAELEKLSDKQRERIEKAKEDKAEQAKKAGKEDKTKAGQTGTAGSERAKRTRVTAGTMEELISKIKNVDWNKIPWQTAESGSRFDSVI